MAGPLLRPDLAVGAVHLPPRLRARGALAREVALEHHRAVEQVAAEGEVEVFAVVGFEAEGLHLRELVDGCKDGRC